ncbi:MAG: hypothetical protein IT540_05750 [Hyphomicrobium sp.]|nr:hypothetical protein [Hyphomicrobium sp.]
MTVGPIWLGAAKPCHILETTATVRRIVNMAALAGVDAASQPTLGNGPIRPHQHERLLVAQCPLFGSNG